MNQRRRLKQIKERRQVCLANRRAGTRSVKPMSLLTWALDRSTVNDGGEPTTALAWNVAHEHCCAPHLRSLKRLKRHLVSDHGMSSDWTGWLDFEAEYMAAVLG